VNRRCVQVKAVVCVKQVGILGDEVEFRADERDVDPEYLERALNEWDVFAVEEALRIAEATGGDASAPDAAKESEVVVVTVGDEEADEALRRCLAMGANRAIRVAADGIDEDDPLTRARRLAVVVDREDPDLVLCGVQSSDAVHAATGVMLAGLLAMACVAVVTKVSYDHAARRAIVHRELEGGLIDVVEVETPAVLAIQTGINVPRYATLRAIRQAGLKEIEVVEPDSPAPGAYRVRRMFVPDRGAGAEMLGNDAATVAARITEIVKARLS
jgi:electron transfer flavoprotein beta subunit